MKINLGKIKAVSFTEARVKERIRYYLGDQLIPEASSFKYLGIIICSNLNWAGHVNYTLQNAWKAPHFIIGILKKGNNTKGLAFTALVRPILEYGAVCWDPHREGRVSSLNRVQKRAAKFANNINESVWETLAQCRLIARICTLVRAYTRGLAWKAIGDRLLKPCYLNRVDHNQKIRTRSQRTDVGKYFFVNRTIKSWNRLPAGLLASFLCKLNTFGKCVKKVVTSKGNQVGVECKLVK